MYFLIMAYFQFLDLFYSYVRKTESFFLYLFPNLLNLGSNRVVNLSPSCLTKLLFCFIFATRYWKDKNHHQKQEERYIWFSCYVIVITMKYNVLVRKRIPMTSIMSSLQHQRNHYMESAAFRNGKYPTQENAEVYKISRSCANCI